MKNIAQNYLNNNVQFGEKIVSSLGKGNFGEAFLSNKNFVIKVTKDKAEYLTVKNKILLNDNINGVITPQYFKVEQYNNYYLIVMEKVKNISFTEKENIIINKFKELIFSFLKLDKDISLVIENIKEKIKDSKLKSILLNLTNIITKLNNFGINNVDIQENNIGMIGNKYVVFDVVDEKYLNENTLESFIKKILLEHHLV